MVLTANFNLSTNLNDISCYNINAYALQQKIIIENVEDWNIKLINSVGKVIFTGRIDSSRKEIPIPAPGIYILKTYRNEDVGSKKIIVR